MTGMMLPCHGWDHAWYCDAVSAEAIRLAEVAAGIDPATPVPSCPGWTIARLVSHTGHVHRWAAYQVRRRSQRRLELPRSDIGLPPDETDYPAWLADGVPSLRAALGEPHPDTPLWAWGRDQHARFWPRRMLHETTVHRADAELALGRDPAVAPAVATDGVDEFLDNLPGAAYFAPGVAELRGSGETLHFAAVDTGVSWWIELGADGFTWRHRDDADPAAATVSVRGRAADLLLLLYGRRDLGLAGDESRLQRQGSDAVLDHWLRHASI